MSPFLFGCKFMLVNLLIYSHIINFCAAANIAFIASCHFCLITGSVFECRDVGKWFFMPEKGYINLITKLYIFLVCDKQVVIQALNRAIDVGKPKTGLIHVS